MQRGKIQIGFFVSWETITSLWKLEDFGRHLNWENGTRGHLFKITFSVSHNKCDEGLSHVYMCHLKRHGTSGYAELALGMYRPKQNILAVAPTHQDG